VRACASITPCEIEEENIMVRYLYSGVVAALCAMLWLSQTTLVSHAEEAPEKPADAKITVAKSFRSSVLNGMSVYNTKGQEVGSIQELVIDIKSGQVEYAALSVGGFLGIGDKLFAVPWRLLSLKMDEDRNYFVLDVDKAVLERAPGFNEDQWPDVADPNWADEIERYYGNTAHEGTFERFENERLVMTADDGESKHSHPYADNLSIQSDGQTVAANALRQGDPIRVTLAKRGEGEPVAIKVEVLEAVKR